VKEAQYYARFIILYSQRGSFQIAQNLSLFKSMFIPILPYDHEAWVMTESVLFEVQAVEVQTCDFCKKFIERCNNLLHNMD